MDHIRIGNIDKLVPNLIGNAIFDLVDANDFGIRNVDLIHRDFKLANRIPNFRNERGFGNPQPERFSIDETWRCPEITVDFRNRDELHVVADSDFGALTA